MTPEQLARDAIRVIDRVEDEQIRTLNNLIGVVQRDFLELAKAIDFTDTSESRAIKQLRIQTVLNQSQAALNLLNIGKANGEVEQQLRANVIASYREGLESSQRAIADTGILTEEQISLVTTFSPRVELEYIDAVTRTTITTLEKVSERTLARLEEELVRTSVRGAGPLAAARSIRDTFDLTRNESERIARTVFMSANNTARLSVFNDLGLNYLQYTAANDDRTCEYCEARHGMVYKIPDVPEVPTHPNCRCVLVPWSPESRPENRGDAYYEETRREMRERREEEGRAGTTATAQAPFERANNVDAPEPVWAPGRGWLDAEAREEAIEAATEAAEMSIDEARRIADEVADLADAEEIVAQRAVIQREQTKRAEIVQEYNESSLRVRAAAAELNQAEFERKRATSLRVSRSPGAPNDEEYLALQRREQELRMAYNAELDRNNALVADFNNQVAVINEAQRELAAVQRQLASQFISNEATGTPLGPVPTYEMRGTVGKPMRAAANEAQEWLHQNTALTPLMSDMPLTSTRQKRSFYQPSDGSLNMTAGLTRTATYIHEIGHLVEGRAPSLISESLAFRERRTANEPLVRIADLLPNHGYKLNERTKADQFIHPYIGKDYGTTASEVMSMGLEFMYENPIDFAVRDPDMFAFILNAMKTRQ
jgi:SPP1 gp7 family putative phage head morphogenesis protein